MYISIPQKAFLNRIPLALAILFALSVVIFAQGCAGVKVKTVEDPQLRSALLKETGFTIAYYALNRESEQAVDRVEKSVVTAISMLETKDIGEIVKLVVAYVEDFPQWKTGLDNYDILITRAVNVLTLLIEADLEVPENYEAAKQGVSAFLCGAQEGIEALRQARVKAQNA